MKRTEYRDLQREGSGWRRVLRGFLSALVPGVGQLVAGERRRGAIMLAAVVLLLIFALVVALQGVDQVLAWVVEPSVLLALLIVNVVLAAFRLYAVTDAYGIRRRRPEPSAGPSAPADPKTGPTDGPAGNSRRRDLIVGLVLALLILFTLAPHAAAGYYVYLSRDLLTTVFVEDDESEPATTSATAPATTSAATSTSATATTSTATPTSGTASATTTELMTSTTSTPSTTEAPPDTTAMIKGAEDGRITILLVGSDAGYGRTGSRADTIMVANFDLDTGRIALFGIPRNTGDAPLTEEAAKALHKKVYVDLISSLYWEAREHPELAAEGEDPGAVVLRDSVSMLLGIPIDYYAVVDMGGFVKVVDALGGVTVNVATRLWVRLSPPTPDEEWKVYDIQPGIQHLSGLEALAFARSRTGSSDYVRMGRQRCVIAALMDQTGLAELVWSFPRIAKVIKESLRTDIPIDTLQQLIEIRSELKTDEMITVGFTPPTYLRKLNSMGYNVLDLELVQATVQKILEHPEEVLESQEQGAEVDDSDCWNFD